MIREEEKISKFKLFGFVSFFCLAFIFAGMNDLQGYEKPKWEWKVEIPNEAVAAKAGWNLYGNSPIKSEDGKYAIYDKNDINEVYIGKEEESETGEIYYIFLLKIYNSRKDNPLATGDYSIGFQNLKFKEGKTYIDDSKGKRDCCCCVLPPHKECVDCSKKSGCMGKCIEDFLVNYDHPSWGYDHVIIQMNVYCDIEQMDSGSSKKTFGYMRRLDIWNTGETLQEGHEDYHNIVCRYSIPLEDVMVKRSSEEEDGGNRWTLIVNQDGSITTCSSLPEGTKHRERCENMREKYKLLGFREMYYQGIQLEREAGKGYIGSAHRIALAARTPFKFKSIWTRVEQKED